MKRTINLPNRLTILRILLTPFVVFFMLWDGKYAPIFSLVLFAVASVTDFFDGKIARSRDIVTDFGKFLDPIADKIIILSILICMIPAGLCSPVAVVIMVFREFTVSSLRLIAASRSYVLAAGISGKIKTASQMISVSVVLFLLSLDIFIEIPFDITLLSNVLMWITAGISVYSGAEYLVKNREFIDPCE